MSQGSKSASEAGSRTELEMRSDLWESAWHRPWQIFTRALPLLLLWLSVPSFLLLLILGLQSIEPTMRSARLPAAPYSLNFRDGSGRSVTLNVSVPRQVASDPQMILSQTVSVRADVAEVEGVSETVIIAVEPSDDRLALVDEVGRPFPQPAIWAVPLERSAAPVHFYVRSRSAIPEQNVALRFRVLQGLGSGNWSSPQTVSLTVEAGWVTWLFRIAGAQSGVIALASTLLVALVGFGVQQWVKLEEEDRDRRRRRDEALAEVASISILLQHSRFDAAAERYRDLSDRTQPPWRDATVRGELKAVWQREAPSELREWVTLLELSGDDLKEALSGRAEEMTRAVLWGFRYLRSGPEEAPRNLVRFVQSTKDVVKAFESVLSDDQAGLQLLRSHFLNTPLGELASSTDIAQDLRECVSRLQAKRRQRSNPFLLRPVERPADPPDIANGIKALGLRDNPFGPEYAELDPRLAEYGVRPEPLWSQVRGSKPVIVFGSPGSGKTALALLLAHDCHYPPANPWEEGAFPVTCPLWPGDPPCADRTPLEVIARAVAEALLQTLAANPHLLLSLDPASQAACASVWCYGLGSTSSEGLIPHLRRAGVQAEDVEAIIRSVQAMMGSTRLASGHDEATLLDLLGKAKPAGYRCTYVLVDLRTEPGGGWIQPTLDLVKPLLKRMIPLAERGVYMKFLLPERFRHFLDEELPADVVHLRWKREDLANMLATRLAYVGLSSLAQVYSDPSSESPPDPDGRVVRAAALLPRQLVRVGNQMLARVEDRPLRPEHLPGERP